MDTSLYSPVVPHSNIYSPSDLLNLQEAYKDHQYMLRSIYPPSRTEIYIEALQHKGFFFSYPPTTKEWNACVEKLNELDGSTMRDAKMLPHKQDRDQAVNEIHVKKIEILEEAIRDCERIRVAEDKKNKAAGVVCAKCRFCWHTLCGPQELLDSHSCDGRNKFVAGRKRDQGEVEKNEQSKKNNKPTKEAKRPCRASVFASTQNK